jgi:hypothetical protein
MIDSAITKNLGKRYFYVDNETPLYVNPRCKVGKNPFETDLVYRTENKRALLFAEETLDPGQKKDQLICYGNVSSQSLKMISHTDEVPTYDVFLVFPQEHRSVALGQYKEVEKEVPSRELGRNIGISLWQYSAKRDVLKCVGGKFSNHISNLVTNLTELKAGGFGSFPILKRADEVSLLIHILLCACQSEYGKKDENIEFSKEKLEKWMAPCGLTNPAKWRAALKIGEDVGLISDFSSDQLMGIINYTKPSSGSITILKKYTSNFFEAIREEKKDRSQTKLDFFERTREESAEEDETKDDMD